ncbi:MAG: hypothetical protein HRU15_01690 [Planctomycetes bacterium]|nr:hypothetical protein [Planctomycetota bacterium]
MYQFVRATETSIIRLFKDGSPLPGQVISQPTEIRLPVCQDIAAVAAKDYGIPGNLRLIIARGRKEAWYVMINRERKTISLDDIHYFMSLSEELSKERRLRSQRLTGWMVTIGDVAESAQKFVNDANPEMQENTALLGSQPSYYITTDALRR